MKLSSHNTTHAQRIDQAGFSYAEVLVASLLIIITLLPSIEALQPAIQSSMVNQRNTIDHFQLLDKMEQVLAEPYDLLESARVMAGNRLIPSRYSDTLTTSDGRQITRQVYLSLYDGDNADGDNDVFTDTKTDLMWIEVSIDKTRLSIQSLVNQ